MIEVTIQNSELFTKDYKYLVSLFEQMVEEDLKRVCKQYYYDVNLFYKVIRIYHSVTSEYVGLIKYDSFDGWVRMLEDERLEKVYKHILKKYRQCILLCQST